MAGTGFCPQGQPSSGPARENWQEGPFEGHGGGNGGAYGYNQQDFRGEGIGGNNFQGSESEFYGDFGVLIKVIMRVAMLMVKGLHRVTTKVTVDRLAIGSMVIEVDLLVVEAVGVTDSYQERIAHPFSQKGDSKMLPLDPLPLQVAHKLILGWVLQRRNKACLEVLWLQIRMYNLRRILRLVRIRSLKNVFIVIFLLIMLVLSVQLLYAYIAILLYIRMLIVTC
jgi:hypothetical protein